MLGTKALAELELRKQALVATSEQYRRSLQAQLSRAASSAAFTDHALRLWRQYKFAWWAASILVGFLTARRKAQKSVAPGKIARCWQWLRTLSQVARWLLRIKK